MNLPLPWVCSYCVADGLQVPPPGPRTDGACGPHADIFRVERWRRATLREDAARRAA